MEKIINILTIIITSTLISGIVSSIVSGFLERRKYIFEKKIEAFSIITNQIISYIDNIPYPKEELYYIQISENSFLEFKSEIEKYILYLNKNNLLLIEEIFKLFSKNIYFEPDCAYDPSESNYMAFDKDDRKKIINLKNDLIKQFQKELGIN